MNLLKNNDNRDWSDVECVQEFVDFLTVDLPDGISMPKRHKPKLTPKTAMAIIWYLQEKFPLIPDNIEKCDDPACNNIFDSNSQGFYSEKRGKHFCQDVCLPRNIKDSEYE